MGVFDRLANLARGSMIVWRKGGEATPTPQEVEDLSRRPARNPDSEESSSEPEGADNTRRPVPETPRPRRL